MSVELTTRLLSKVSSPKLDKIVKKLAANDKLHSLLSSRQSSKLKKIRNPQKILVIPDINIGDAVIGQVILSLLKRNFPDIEINYVYQKKAYPLIFPNPYIDNHYPIFGNIGFPSGKDINELQSVVQKNNSDLIINLCPYFPSKIFKKSDSVILFPLKLITDIIRAYDSNNKKSHYALHAKKFCEDLISRISDFHGTPSQDANNIPFPHIFASTELKMETDEMMKNLKIPQNSKKILYNPDSSSKYTCIPLKFQIDLLKGILSHQKLDFIIMNCGFTFEGIEKAILKNIPTALRKKVIVIPKKTEIHKYSALIDRMDMFISGDTGPLHIAAARKYFLNSENHFKNSTAIVGIFGATSGKIYGYDSFAKKYFPSAQDAPSKVFESSPPCKNLTCIDKLFKTCQEVRCFEGLESDEVVEYVNKYFEKIS